MSRQAALELIHRNIEEFGFHVYLVNGALTPRYVYTIGLSEKCSFELLFAGSLIFSNEDAAKIVDHISRILMDSPSDE